MMGFGTVGSMPGFRGGSSGDDIHERKPWNFGHPKPDSFKMFQVLDFSPGRDAGPRRFGRFA